MTTVMNTPPASPPLAPLPAQTIPLSASSRHREVQDYPRIDTANVSHRPDEQSDAQITPSTTSTSFNSSLSESTGLGSPTTTATSPTLTVKGSPYPQSSQPIASTSTSNSPQKPDVLYIPPLEGELDNVDEKFLEDWNPDKVTKWLESNGWNIYVDVFREQNIYGKRFFDLKLGDLHKYNEFLQDEPKPGYKEHRRFLSDLRTIHLPISETSPTLNSPKAQVDSKSSAPYPFSSSHERSPTSESLYGTSPSGFSSSPPAQRNVGFHGLGQNIYQNNESLNPQQQSQHPYFPHSAATYPLASSSSSSSRTNGLRVQTTLPVINSNAIDGAPVISPRSTSIDYKNTNPTDQDYAKIAPFIPVRTSSTPEKIMQIFGNPVIPAFGGRAGGIPRPVNLPSKTAKPTKSISSNLTTPAEDQSHLQPSPKSPKATEKDKRKSKSNTYRLTPGIQDKDTIPKQNIIQVTKDNDVHFSVDVTDVDIIGIEGIKEKIFKRLSIPSQWEKYRCFFLNGPIPDSPLTEKELITLCKTANGTAWIRLLVKNIFPLALEPFGPQPSTRPTVQNQSHRSSTSHPSSTENLLSLDALNRLTPSQSSSTENLSWPPSLAYGTITDSLPPGTQQLFDSSAPRTSFSGPTTKGTAGPQQAVPQQLSTSWGNQWTPQQSQPPSSPPVKPAPSPTQWLPSWQNTSPHHPTGYTLSDPPVGSHIVSTDDNVDIRHERSISSSSAFEEERTRSTNRIKGLEVDPGNSEPSLSLKDGKDNSLWEVAPSHPSRTPSSQGLWEVAPSQPTLHAKTVPEKADMSALWEVKPSISTSATPRKVSSSSVTENSLPELSFAKQSNDDSNAIHINSQARNFMSDSREDDGSHKKNGSLSINTPSVGSGELKSHVSPVSPQVSNEQQHDLLKPPSKENFWGERPPADHMYNNLDRYFKDHDLDQPIDIVSIPVPPLPPVAAVTELKRPLAHTKSIRQVVNEKRHHLKQTGNNIGVNQSMLRRKSTKMWGSKVVEVKPPGKGDLFPLPERTVERKSPTEQLQLHESVQDRLAAAANKIQWIRGELIGKGSFGRVYHAMNVATGEVIAVKQVEIPKTASDRLCQRQKDMVKSLYDEIALLKDLDHENIVQYLGFEANDDTINIFLEYVSGGSITSCLQRNGPFEEPVVRNFTGQILNGLAYLHNMNILHRDIKAANVLVDEEGICKISDFGLSKKNDYNEAYQQNSRMSLQGSIFWMAPEVVKNLPYSAKIDIWSLGCVVLEMMTGERPWLQLDTFSALYQLGQYKAPPLPENNSETGNDFLQNTFIIDPEQRPTAAVLLKHPFCTLDPTFRFRDYVRKGKM